MSQNFFSAEERDFLENNYYALTNMQLLTQINAKRNSHISLSTMLSHCHRIGLTRGMQIRWSKEDIQFLKANFRNHGDLELSQMLNERGLTFRVVNGENVFRTFTKKHVEKKRSLLGLIRTSEEVKQIRRRNNRIFHQGFTTENNLWAKGFWQSFPEKQVRVWRQEQRSIKYIKVNGKFVPLHRYNFEKTHGPIPKGKIIRAKDGNLMNCDPANWELVDRLEHLEKNTGRGELTDGYIISKLSVRQPEMKGALAQMPEIIELKRNQIKLRRTINELSETGKNDHRR